MQGDPVIDRLMQPVAAAIGRHANNQNTFTDIYNRAYEAVSNGLVVLDTMRDQLSKANARAEVAERDLAALKEQTRWRFDPDDTLVMGERVEILFQSRYISIATPVNTLDADFLTSKFGCRWINDAGNGCVNVEAWRPLPEPPEDA